jgi:hypothetical protein
MSLTKEQIIKNTKRYLSTARKHGFMTEELETLLGEDLIKAPASTFEHLHNAFEGGLVDHSLRVAKHMVYINQNNLIDELKVSEKSLLKVALLHGIGKVKLYVPETNPWQRENRGKFYDFNSDLVSMRVGERSVYYALTSGIDLTDEEYAAIVNYDKVDDVQSEWHNTTLGDLLRLAIKLAIMEEKHLAK